jgi:uncharacterized hydrophobic protein (TIGR00271 family)
MLNVRVVSPPDVTGRLVEALATDDGVLNLIVLEDAARNPRGDAVQFDVLAARANAVLALLRGLGVDGRGSIMLEDITSGISARADAVRSTIRHALTAPPIWEEVEARIKSAAFYSFSWFALLTIAALIGAIGIFTNSQILVVGAMVVGPEYTALISMALALNHHDQGTVRSGALALVIGFAIAIVASLCFSLLVRAFGWEPAEFNEGIRPVSDLINSPNAFSVIVAALAGVVGVVSLVEARGNTLIGVFISVTTIPAAADIGVSSAFGLWKEARGSLVQLLLNLAILLVVGAVGLQLQRRFWTHRAVRAGAGSAGDVTS